ncbi:hypothetical protein EDD15DRAFT_2367453 [Pisolithus albus]|nr:hypothetical protein EDD15DRAFT_2367453 [Pisolithus albus]
MARKRLHQRLLSSDDGVPPEPSTSQPSYLVDSVIQKMLSTASFPASSSQVPLPTGSKPLMASYKQADLESNRGLKGKSRAVSAHTSCSDPIPRKDKHSKPMSLSFSISRIVFLPCGTMEPDDYGSMDDSGPSLAHLFPVIQSPKAPSTADISRLEALGLARANYRDFFEFNRDWDFPQVDGVLRSLFPTLFAYLDTQGKTTNHNYGSSEQDPCYKYLPPYHLCVKSQRRVAIASGVDFPTGEIIYTKVSLQKYTHTTKPMPPTPVTHEKIPYSVLEQWKSRTTKGAGKRKAVCWLRITVADSDSDFDVPVSALRRHSKHLRVTDDADDIPVVPPMEDNLPVTPFVADDIPVTPFMADDIPVTPFMADDIPATLPMSPSIIDLSGDTEIMATADSNPPPADLPDTSTAPTAPSTPTPGSRVQPPPHSTGSFTVDDTIADPWKANRTFHF